MASNCFDNRPCFWCYGSHPGIISLAVFCNIVSSKLQITGHLTCLAVVHYGTVNQCQEWSRAHQVGWRLGLQRWSPGVLGNEIGASYPRTFGTQRARLQLNRGQRAFQTDRWTTLLALWGSPVVSGSYCKPRSPTRVKKLYQSQRAIMLACHCRSVQQEPQPEKMNTNTMLNAPRTEPALWIDLSSVSATDRVSPICVSLSLM